MKKLTPQQRAIKAYLQDGPRKKSEIVNQYKHWYYSNADKYIGEILSRMVKIRLISRDSLGVYSLSHSTLTQRPENSEQISLF